jgi:hypothetical protein
MLRTLLLGAALAALTGPAVAQTLELYGSNDRKLDLGSFSFDGGKTLVLSHGIGSAAFRRADAPDGIFVTVGDRGPNFTCGDAEGVIGLKGEAFCGDVRQGRIYPLPGYSPSIYRIRVADGAFEVLDIVTLKDAAGVPVSGLPNRLTVASTENPLDGRARPLEQSAGSVDLEGIVELADGTFWIGEENAPSILHVAADGRILMRLVPAGTEQDFKDAGYPVRGALPALLARRMANRGIESMAVSPDERFLFLVMQNPLANPDIKTYQQARNARLLKLDRQTGGVVAQWVYELTAMADFKGEETRPASTARISELLAIDGDRLLLLDRTERATKIFEIDTRGATNIAGSRWDDPRTSPSLEQVTLAEAGIVPVTKRLVLDSANHPELPTKIEGMAWFANGDLMLINDNDFGITGEITKVARVKGLPVRP